MSAEPDGGEPSTISLLLLLECCALAFALGAGIPLIADLVL